MDERIEARGRVVHASLAFAAQVWSSWDDEGPSSGEDLDEALDRAVIVYAEHLGLIPIDVAWPHLEEEVPQAVIEAAQSVLALRTISAVPRAESDRETVLSMLRRLTPPEEALDLPYVPQTAAPRWPAFVRSMLAGVMAFALGACVVAPPWRSLVMV